MLELFDSSWLRAFERTSEHAVQHMLTLPAAMIATHCLSLNAPTVAPGANLALVSALVITNYNVLQHAVQTEACNTGVLLCCCSCLAAS